MFIIGEVKNGKTPSGRHVSIVHAAPTELEILSFSPNYKHAAPTGLVGPFQLNSQAST